MVYPCKYCYLYPRNCPTINGCKSRTDYINEVDEDVPIVRRNKEHKRESHVFYEHGKKYEYNKNGIRREIC